MPDSLRRKIDLIIARAGISLNDEETSLNMPTIDEFFGIGQPADQVGAN
jgi:hypothetical protein